ncbi:hypothetical protein O0L34_g15406 [Tuta absoluta]|nr:hypothetical protein O0L34_g15406 [Tuta absoluta]
MSESLFDIFGDRLSQNSSRNLPRQPISNNENIGKVVSTGPVKPNEPLKKAGEMKKSFLSNAGKALRDIQTPNQKVYSPVCRNVQSSTKKVLTSQLIYSDDLDDDAMKFYEELEFTRPTYKYDHLVDYLMGPEPMAAHSPTPPRTPSPVQVCRNMDLDCSYEDDFFKDDFPQYNDSNPISEDEFPDLFDD